MSERTSRGGMFRAGLAIAIVGAVLGVTGITAAPAGAAKPDTFKVDDLPSHERADEPLPGASRSACDAGNGEIVGPDHTGHLGPIVRLHRRPGTRLARTTTPRNGDQWGDIIPPLRLATAGRTPA